MSARGSALHLPYLDGWRGLAILLLLMGHFLPVPGLDLGGAGVNFFFVLSGLLMGRVLFIDATPLGRFYRRRIARIFPVAYLFIFIVCIVALLAGQQLHWRDIGAAVLFMNNYVLAAPAPDALPLGHFWSLCVEEHSYVLLSLAALAVRAGRIGARAAVGGLTLASFALGSAYWATHPGQLLHYSLRLHTEVSAFGILLSVFLLLHWHKRGVPRAPAAAVPILLGLGIVSGWWSVPEWLGMYAGVGALAVAVNLLVRAPRLLHRALSLLPLRQLGVWSFSIYIWQQPFYLAVKAGRLHVAAGLAAALGAGVLSFYLVEQPLRNWLNRHWTGRVANLTP